MGWHTLKRKDRSLKKKNSTSEKSFDEDSNTKNESVKNILTNDLLDQISFDDLNISLNQDESVKTLLAKALYDNLADAPDELTFRKGDIVTVIEKDVDGLVGWWLCLLHGRQGIVPGNRLQVIPPVELDRFERENNRRASYETDEFSDANDGPNYDHLPAPTKATPTTPSPSSQQALSIKDMFNIPYKNESKTEREEVYDIPKNNHDITQEIYDIPKSNTNTNKVQNSDDFHNIPKSANLQEIYDIPKNENNSAEVYDIPKAQVSEEFYDIPKSQTKLNYDVPKSQIVHEETYDIPKSNVVQEEFYDVPKSHVPDETYDVPKAKQQENEIEKQEVYDIPKSKNTPKGKGSNFNRRQNRNNIKNTTNVTTDETYDVPNSKMSVHQLLLSQLQNPQVENNGTVNQTKQQTVFDVDELMGEIYDSPFIGEHSVSTIKRSPRTSKSNTPRNSQQIQLGDNEIYDVPTPSNRSSVHDVFHTPMGSSEKISDEVYDTPKSNFLREEIYSTPRGSMERIPQEIYDVPKDQKASNISFRKVFEETFDVPEKISLSTSRTSQTLPRQFSPFKPNTETIEGEIYDTPPRRNTSQKIVRSTEGEIYDTPPPSRSTSQKFVRDDIYDVPISRDVNKVMEDARSSSPYTSRPARNNLAAEQYLTDDDYVDYHDIWSNEPPKDLVREHAQSISSSTGKLSPTLSQTSSSPKRHSSGDPKKSVLDQINFAAVKELEVTVSDALQRLGKLHLAVDTCVQALIAYSNDDWLDIRNLQDTIGSIRDFAGKLKTALRLLTEFGLGTLVNTTKSVNGEMLMDKLIVDVEPLLESYYKIKICLLHLDSNNWSVPTHRSSSNEKFFATLNAIMILSQRIPDQCRRFSLAVQNNANELFDPDPAPLPSIVNPGGSVKNKKFSNANLLNEKPADTTKREMIDRRQQGRDYSTLSRQIPKIPPKPSLPNQRRSLAGVLEPPESPRYNLVGRGFNHIERLVTDYIPEDDRQKKYASDPATPSYTDGQKIVWGGSCPILLGRNSAAAAVTTPLRMNESYSSTSSAGASITEETIEIRQTTLTTSDKMNKVYPSDSNLRSPVLSPLHSRSASLPWDERRKNTFTFDDNNEKPVISSLDHRDIEALEFFCRQVESQVMLLRESMKNLTETVENREEPAVFVSHSKFIILTAHKVVHGGQENSERLINDNIKNKLKEGTAHLTVCIRGVVGATKTAALEYPDNTALMEMISSVLALGDAVRILHSECRRAIDN